MAKVNKIFIFDFDSTFVQVEALDLLAEISLSSKEAGLTTDQAKQRVQQIQELTNLGMEGKLSFGESLRKRLDLLSANKQQVEELVKALHKKISPSFQRNKNFFKKYSSQIYVISGGFKDYIVPVVAKFGIKPANVFANTFIFDAGGRITGLDKKNVLSSDQGKVKQLKAFNNNPEIYMIGDGYTDLETKLKGVASKFFAFTENVFRPSVVDQADYSVASLDEFLHLNGLPRRLSYPKNKIKALLLENIDSQAREMLEAEGYKVETATGALSAEDLEQAIEDVSLLGIRSKTEVTAKTLAKARKLLAVGAFCIGTNQIDLKASAAAGVCVFNAPYSNTRSVVELAIGEIIVLQRKVLQLSNQAHAGNWVKSAAGSREIRGRTLGLVGYGNIGMQLSTIAEALGMNVVFFDLVDKLALGNARRCKNLKELLKQADIVSLHIDGRSSNQDFFGAEEFAAMKQGAIFLNLSRGHVVNIKSLAAALKSGKIAGAAVDVFPYEPANNKEKFQSELIGLPNVILTPHIGGSTEEAQRNIAEYVSTRFIEYINSGTTYGSVNLPAIMPPVLKGAHRLLHLHENVPGVLAQINSLMAQGKINILGQYLKTSEDFGYVITDVNKKYSEEILDSLRQIPGTTKFRVLY